MNRCRYSPSSSAAGSSRSSVGWICVSSLQEPQLRHRHRHRDEFLLPARERLARRASVQPQRNVRAVRTGVRDRPRPITRARALERLGEAVLLGPSALVAELHRQTGERRELLAPVRLQPSDERLAGVEKSTRRGERARVPTAADRHRTSATRCAASAPACSEATCRRTEVPRGTRTSRASGAAGNHPPQRAGARPDRSPARQTPVRALPGTRHCGRRCEPWSPRG